MQERITHLDDCPIGASEATLEEDVSGLSDVEDLAEMVHGYVECMAEAVRYLVEVENYSDEDPAVEALRHHLQDYRRRLVETALAGL